MSDVSEKFGLPEGTIVHEQATVGFTECSDVEIRRRMALAAQALVEEGQARLSAVVVIGTYRCGLHQAHVPSLVGLPEGVDAAGLVEEMRAIAGRMREVADDLEHNYLAKAAPRAV